MRIITKRKNYYFSVHSSKRVTFGDDDDSGKLQPQHAH